MVDKDSDARALEMAREAIEGCVLRGLDMVGLSGRDVILFYVKSRFGLSVEKIPDDPDSFVTALRTIFGIRAASLLESIIHELGEYSPQSESEGEQVESFTNTLREGKLSVEQGIM